MAVLNSEQSFLLIILCCIIFCHLLYSTVTIFLLVKFTNKATTTSTEYENLTLALHTLYSIIDDRKLLIENEINKLNKQFGSSKYKSKTYRDKKLELVQKQATEIYKILPKHTRSILEKWYSTEGLSFHIYNLLLTNIQQ